MTFSSSTVIESGVGIGMGDVFEINCTQTGKSIDTTGDYIEIVFTDRTFNISTNATTANMVSTLQDGFDSECEDVEITVTHENTHSRICHHDPANPVISSTRLMITCSSSGTLSVFQVMSSRNVDLTVDKIQKGFDQIQYLDHGLYEVFYTPTKSGHYFVHLKIANSYIWTDVSIGLNIYPSFADSLMSYHDAQQVVTVGKEENFIIQAVDRFGNKLRSALDVGSKFIVSLHGKPHDCSNFSGDTSTNASVQLLSEANGQYSVSYVPEVDNFSIDEKFTMY